MKANAGGGPHVNKRLVVETPAPPKHYSNGHCCWLPTRTRGQDTIAEDTTGLDHWAEEGQAGPRLEESPAGQPTQCRKVSRRLLGGNCHPRSHSAVDPVSRDPHRNVDEFHTNSYTYTHSRKCCLGQEYVRLYSPFIEQSLTSLFFLVEVLVSWDILISS